MTDPYHALGVHKSATPADIKRSYRRLALAHHPDHQQGDKHAEERFKDISTAYDLLSDPIKRRKFDTGEIDAMGNARPGYGGRNGGGFGGGFGRASPEYQAHPRTPGAGRKNPFNGFFRDRAEKGPQSIKARGADVSYTLKVTFLDAARGTLKEVRMASGKTLKVNIPAGTESGRILRLKGQGMEGLGGGGAGDALVEIRGQGDANFHADGLDVYSEEPVTLGEAVLGGRIEVQTIHGVVRVTVPEGSNSGTKLRLKTKGVRPHGRSEQGDHYVSLKVMLPEDEDSDLKKFVKKWTSKRPYNVRKSAAKRSVTP